jgi:hypothetical protein
MLISYEKLKEALSLGVTNYQKDNYDKDEKGQYNKIRFFSFHGPEGCQRAQKAEKYLSLINPSNVHDLLLFTYAILTNSGGATLRRYITDAIVDQKIFSEFDYSHMQKAVQNEISKQFNFDPQSGLAVAFADGIANECLVKQQTVNKLILALIQENLLKKEHKITDLNQHIKNFWYNLNNETIGHDNIVSISSAVIHSASNVDMISPQNACNSTPSMIRSDTSYQLYSPHSANDIELQSPTALRSPSNVVPQDSSATSTPMHVEIKSP